MRINERRELFWHKLGWNVVCFFRRESANCLTVRVAVIKICFYLESTEGSTSKIGASSGSMWILFLQNLWVLFGSIIYCYADPISQSHLELGHWNISGWSWRAERDEQLIVFALWSQKLQTVFQEPSHVNRTWNRTLMNFTEEKRDGSLCGSDAGLKFLFHSVLNSSGDCGIKVCRNTFKVCPWATQEGGVSF